MNAETIESLCQKAQQAVAQGQNEVARKYYAKALSLQSDLPNVHYGMATVCYLLGDLSSAATHFKEVTRLDPVRAGAYINLGAVYNKLDRLDDAIEVLRRGIQLDLNRAEGYYNLGLVYRRKGQVDLAIQAYREATRTNQRMPDAHYNLANLYMEKEQYHLALSHYKKALELKPGWPKAIHGMEQAQAGLLEVESPEMRRPRPEETVDEEPPTQKILDPNRFVDPELHTSQLKELHHATKEAEELGRTFGSVVLNEIEPALKMLSSCLLHSNQSATELDQCVEKVEQALVRMRSAQKSLGSSMEKVRQAGEKLIQS